MKLELLNDDELKNIKSNVDEDLDIKKIDESELRLPRASPFDYKQKVIEYLGNEDYSFRLKSRSSLMKCALGGTPSYLLLISRRKK